MVKGVNKQIIEINDTGSKYFEKVLLFVAPGKTDLPQDLLNARAKEYMLEFSENNCKSVSLRDRITRKRNKNKAKLVLCISAIITIAAAVIINIL